MTRISQKDFFSEYGGLNNLNKLDDFCKAGIKTTREEKKGLFRFGKETMASKGDQNVQMAHIAKILKQDFKAASKSGDKDKLAQIATNLWTSEREVIGDKKPNKKQEARIELYKSIIKASEVNEESSDKDKRVSGDNVLKLSNKDMLKDDSKLKEFKAKIPQFLQIANKQFPDNHPHKDEIMVSIKEYLTRARIQDDGKIHITLNFMARVFREDQKEEEEKHEAINSALDDFFNKKNKDLFSGISIGAWE